MNVVFSMCKQKHFDFETDFPEMSAINWRVKPYFAEKKTKTNIEIFFSSMNFEQMGECIMDIYRQYKLDFEHEQHFLSTKQ